MELVKALRGLMLAAIGGLILLSQVKGQEPSDSQTSLAELKTVAEASDYQQTSTSAEVAEFLQTVVQQGNRITLESIGTTCENRPLWAARFQGKPSLAAEEALRVLVIANIHSGECDGKEAMLALLRDLTLDAQHRWQETPLDLIVIPNYNADGNDRRGPGHRPGQVGPDRMGIRENAQQLDLNRDFIKLEAPETRSLIALANVFNPHLFIDCHTTNGSRHGYTLTYDVPHHPATAADIRDELRSELIPWVTQRMAEVGFPTFYYGNFNSERTRWDTYGYEPRYSTEYFGLRGTLAILSESYSYATYKDRVLSSRAFVEACIDAALLRRDSILEITHKNWSAQAKLTEPLALRAQQTKFDEKSVVLYRNQEGGEEALELEFWGKYVPSEGVLPPLAYAIPEERSWVVERLRWHGLTVEQLQESWQGDVTAWVMRELNRQESFQRHARLELACAPVTEQRDLPAGTWIVRIDQSQWRLLMQLLEPRGADSLVSWNFMDDAVAVGQSLPIVRIESSEVSPLAAMQLETVDVIPPSERLTLDKVWGPEGRIDYSGSVDLAMSWDNKQPHLLKRRWNGRPVLVDAQSGAMGSAPQAADPSEPIARTLTGWNELDERTARTLARRASTNSNATHQVVAHEGNLILIDAQANTARWLTQGTPAVELYEFSPTGQSISFVRGNNLFVASIDGGEPIAVTTEGDATHFFGKFDWVYQEELYGRGNFKAYWWSPSGRYIAFLSLDETNVPSFSVVDQIPVHQELEVSSYPKAGDPNPIVGLGLWDSQDQSLRWIDLSVTSTPEPLISRVGWAGERDLLVYQIQDRVQTFLDFRRFDPESGSNSLLIREESPAWIETPGDPTWLKDGSFLWLSPRSGSQHVYLCDADGKVIRQLTSGPGEVRSINKVDEARGEVWLSGTFDSRIETHAYRVALSGGPVQRVTELGWSHSVSVSPSGEYLTDSASQAGRPIQMRLIDREGNLKQLLEPNLPERLRHVAIRLPETMAVEARDGHRLDAQWILPPDFDPNKKYPVLIHVYSGPQAPTVRQSWSGTTYLWHQMLAQQGVVIWMCDNRSATYGGASDAWPIHRRMGENELRDIEDGITWLKQQPWIDGDRIGIWGWSYGGYMSAYALTHSRSFRLGIAGAPVTDWKNYDSIYTERYMGLPSENEAGYRSSSVVEAAADLHGHLLLIHGAIDDNVHLTNSMQLVYELQKANKSFELMIYPRNRHGVTDLKQNRHLRELMTRAILERL